MINFMINIKLPDFLDDDFILLIPEQRAHIDTLMAKGVVLNYSLSVDRSLLWVVLSAKNTKDVERILRSFPIADFITYEIIELVFHNSSSVFFPTMSLN